MPYDIATTSLRHRRFLPKRGTLVLDGARGTTIAVDQGTLWVTFESDLRDIILTGGMRFEIDRSGRTVIAAEADSRLRLIRRKTLRGRFHAWLKRTSAALAQIVVASATAEGRAGLLRRRKFVPYY
jgi:hypothetical protein